MLSLLWVKAVGGSIDRRRGIGLAFNIYHDCKTRSKLRPPLMPDFDHMTVIIFSISLLVFSAFSFVEYFC